MFQNKFSVISFTREGNRLTTVPSSWLIGDDDNGYRCYWPDACVADQIQIVHCPPPEASWDVHDGVEIIFSSGMHIYL